MVKRIRRARSDVTWSFAKAIDERESDRNLCSHCSTKKLNPTACPQLRLNTYNRENMCAVRCIYHTQTTVPIPS